VWRFVLWPDRLPAEQIGAQILLVAVAEDRHGRRVAADSNEGGSTMASKGTIPAAEPLRLVDLITPTQGGIASRVLAKTGGGNVTLFAFDGGEGLSEHTAPFDALVLVLEGSLALTIGGEAIDATPGTIVRMPANVPHAVEATTASRLLLVMLREPTPADQG
jgi:quercetin dioxygenase-like cupin family protein